MADTLEIFGEEYANATGIKAYDDNGDLLTFVKPNLRDITIEPDTYTLNYFGNLEAVDNVLCKATISSTYNCSISHTWSGLVSGTTYHAKGKGTITRAGFSAFTVSVDADITFGTNVSVPFTIVSGTSYLSSITITASGLSFSFSTSADWVFDFNLFFCTASSYTGFSQVTVTPMPSGSATAPASISGTSATVSTGTNTLTLTKTVSVTPTVSAGYVSRGTAGNSSVSLTASVTTQGAQTIHPSTSDQSIAASRYLTGAQTIKGVTTTNLTAANIKKDVVIKIGDSTDDDCVISITGTLEGETYPSASGVSF